MLYKFTLIGLYINLLIFVENPHFDIFIIVCLSRDMCDFWTSLTSVRRDVTAEEASVLSTPSALEVETAGEATACDVG